jgi:hypothetical protein
MTISLRVGEGDVVGAGILPHGELFLTLNGRLLAVPAQIPGKQLKTKLRPTVGTCAPTAQVHVNFGQQPFMFDFNVECLRFSSNPFSNQVSPLSHAPGSISTSHKAFYWLWDQLFALRLETSDVALIPINLVTQGVDPRFTPICNGNALNCVINDTMWVFIKSEEGESMKDFWHPFFRIWSIDLRTGNAQLHLIDSTALRRPLVDQLPIEFWLLPVGEKILFSFEPQFCSFYFDTEALQLVEIFPDCPPAGLVEKHLVDGIAYASSNEYEYPWQSMIFSCLESGDWAAPRCEGDPVPHRFCQVHSTWKNKIVLVGGGTSAGTALDLSVVTAGDGSADSNSGLYFLLTEEGRQMADVSIICSDEVAVRVHLVIMKARASGFLSMPRTNEYRVNFSSTILLRILEYIYTDTLSRDMSDLEAQQVAAAFDAFAPEHSIRACEYLALSRVSTQSTLPSDMLRAYRDMDSHDVRIQAGGAVFNVHRCILAARSNYFRAMLLGGLKESTSREIVLEDILGDAFSEVMSHIYIGRSDYTKFEPIIVEVLVAASRFGVEDLVQLLEPIVSQNVDNENVDSLLSTSEACGFHNLMAACRKYLATQQSV